MDIVAVVISLISLAVAGLGTALANKRAKEAIAESRKAAASALWSGVQEAIQRMIGFDPASEPIGERYCVTEGVFAYVAVDKDGKPRQVPREQNPALQEVLAGGMPAGDFCSVKAGV